MSKRKFGYRKRAKWNEDHNKLIEYYSAIVYDRNNNPVYVADKGEILEFDTKKEALKEAEETYNQFKGELWK